MSDRRTICIVFMVSFVAATNSHCTQSYGVDVCSFVPAPPGKTPPCAHPGLTYCEHPEHYPNQRIQYLIQKWRYNYGTILLDESKEEFTSYNYYPYPAPTYKYGPPNTLKQDSYYPEPIYIPKPPYQHDPTTRLGNSYIPPYPSNLQNQTFPGYPERRPPESQFLNYKYSNSIPPSTSPQGGEVYPAASAFYTPVGLPSPTNPFIKIWNRKDDKYGKSLLIRKKRSEKVKSHLRKLRSTSSASNGTTPSGRTKRQSAIAGQTLCETRSQFIMPRAALNNKGNWMYVVNMPEMDNKLTQLVKSETCASQTCSGLCSLPLGYTSRCEQKYVQKRLVALEGGGNELYNDVFWIPSCCVCTITNS